MITGQEFEGFRRSVLAGLTPAVGDILPVMVGRARAGCIPLAGQEVARAEYPELWAWASARGFVGPGRPFGVGDGATTFTLPDSRGRIAGQRSGSVDVHWLIAAGGTDGR